MTNNQTTKPDETTISGAPAKQQHMPVINLETPTDGNMTRVKLKTEQGEVTVVLRASGPALFLEVGVPTAADVLFFPDSDDAIDVQSIAHKHVSAFDVVEWIENTKQLETLKEAASILGGAL